MEKEMKFIISIVIFAKMTNSEISGHFLISAPFDFQIMVTYSKL
jgi:hypothetical protein